VRKYNFYIFFITLNKKLYLCALNYLDKNVYIKNREKDGIRLIINKIYNIMGTICWKAFDMKSVLWRREKKRKNGEIHSPIRPFLAMWIGNTLKTSDKISSVITKP
jgi:hypothetical protein